MRNVGNVKQQNYGVAVWHIDNPQGKHYAKFGTLKATRWYVEEAYITEENWKRLLDGETVPNMDDPNYVYALAWKRDEILPAFY